MCVHVSEHACGGDEVLKGMCFRIGDPRTCLHDDENNLKGRTKWMKQKKEYLKEQRKSLSRGTRRNPELRWKNSPPIREGAPPLL